jgi:ABC-type transport system involved in cytochrome c biogenesis permease subunit
MSKSNLLAVLVTIAMVAAAGVFFFFDPAQGGFYPSCMFHNLTGLNCPGCGSLRALHHLTHGELLAAFRSNPLLITLLPLFAFIGARWLKRGRVTFANDLILLRPAVAWTLLVITIAFAVLRNLPWPAFAWMSP